MDRSRSGTASAMLVIASVSGAGVIELATSARRLVISQHEVAVTENVNLLSVAPVKWRRQKTRLDCGTSRRPCGSDIGRVPGAPRQPPPNGPQRNASSGRVIVEQTPGSLQHLGDLLIAGGENAAANSRPSGSCWPRSKSAATTPNLTVLSASDIPVMRFRFRDRFRDLDYGWLHEGHGV